MKSSASESKPFQSTYIHTYIHTYILYWLVPTGLFRVNLHYKIINQVHDNKNITMVKEDKGQ